MHHDQLYLEIIENLCDGVYIVDAERKITFWNKAAEAITGYKRAEIVGKRCYDNLLSHIDMDGCALCQLGCPLEATVRDRKHQKAEVYLRHKDGHRVPVTVTVFPVLEGDQVAGAVEIFTTTSLMVYDDVLVERLSHLAMNDPLTGLSNRRRLESYLAYRFHEMKRFSNKFCIVFMDIDDFRDFNNTYGHVAGDELLRGIAKSVMESMRKADIFGRWGGEEFVGVFEIKSDYEAEIVAEKIRTLVENTEIRCGDQVVSATASLGVTVPHIDDTIESVIERADRLMYASKRRGKNCTTTDVKRSCQGDVAASKRPGNV